jgi:hypothetical protein
MATNGDLARRLLGAAENDELMAKSVLPVPGVTDAGVGNLCQQAVEKAIKAVLAAEETEFPFTHNLKQLRDFAEKSEIELPSTLDDVEDRPRSRRLSDTGPKPRSRTGAQMGRRRHRVGPRHRSPVRAQTRFRDRLGSRAGSGLRRDRQERLRAQVAVGCEGGERGWESVVTRRWAARRRRGLLLVCAGGVVWARGLSGAPWNPGKQTPARRAAQPAPR